MRVILHVVGALIILMGGLWIIRGSELAPDGSVQLRWLLYGVVALITGRVLVVLSRR